MVDFRILGFQDMRIGRIAESQKCRNAEMDNQDHRIE
jgi:hypothetical protein